MSYEEFIEVLSCEVAIDGKSEKILFKPYEYELNDPKNMILCLIHFAAKFPESHKLITEFERIAVRTIDKEGFLLRLRVLIEHLNLLEAEHYKRDIFHKGLSWDNTEVLDFGKKQIARINIIQLHRWLTKSELPIANPEKLFVWLGPTKKFCELLQTLVATKWIKYLDGETATEYLAKRVDATIVFDQKEDMDVGSLARMFRPDSTVKGQLNMESLSQCYYGLQKAYGGPYFEKIIENKGLKEAPPKKKKKSI